MTTKSLKPSISKAIMEKYYLCEITDEWTNLLDEYRYYAQTLCDKEIALIDEKMERGSRRKDLESRKAFLVNADDQWLHQDLLKEVSTYLDSCVIEGIDSDFEYEEFFKLVLGK